MQITYFWTIYRKGKKEAVLLNIGYNLMSGPIKVVSFIEKNSEQELTCEVVEVGENNEKFQEVSVFILIPFQKREL